MIPYRLNPMGIDRDYPLMEFEKDGNLVNQTDIEGTLNNEPYTITFASFPFETGIYTHSVDVDTTGMTTGGLRVQILLYEEDGVTIEGGSGGYTSVPYGQERARYSKSYNLIKGRKVVVRISRSVNTTAGETYKTYNTMFCKGTNPTYEAYNPYTYSVEGQSTQVGIPSPENPIPIVSNYPKGVYKTNLPSVPYIRLYEDLRGIGIYKDKVVVNIQTKQKMLTKKIKHYIYTGNEGFELVAGYQFCKLISGVDLAPLLSDEILCYSTHYPCFARDSLTDPQGAAVNYNYIRINDNRYTTVVDFKNFLTAQYNANTPVIVDYVLATPINQEL